MSGKFDKDKTLLKSMIWQTEIIALQACHVKLHLKDGACRYALR